MPRLTDLRIHDPSTLIRERDTYYVFGTGNGIPVHASTDLLHWKPCGRVFRDVPEALRKAVPGQGGMYLWAPDVALIGGRYLLYYAFSAFGKNTSAIGLATATSLEKGDWTDQGVVIQSRRGDNFNAIDPAILHTAEGGLYLSLGSFWSGIQLIRLDSVTGKCLNTAIQPIAAHPQSADNAIEAPYIFADRGYYYLFVNWDLCCRGERSTYNIRVGRSRTVNGPYRDRDGIPMLQGGGTLFAGAAEDGSLVGPGHAGILRDNGTLVFSCHYEYASALGGRPALAVGRVVYGSDGWPTLADL
jgi:arabinan endo-1,5-alpha-L-arabinosidase